MNEFTAVQDLDFTVAMGSDQYTYVGAYTLENSEIQSAKDLIGKQIGVNTLGAQYEFTIMNYLREGGLTEEEIAEVALVTVPVAGAEQALRNNQVDVVLLAGVSRDLALERGGLTEIFRDIDIFGGDTITANYFFSDKFIEQNPETVKTFVEGVAKAIEWAKATPVEEVKTRFEDIIKKRNPNETTDNLKFWQGTGIGSEGGVIKDSDYSIWIEQLVNSGELKEGQVTPTDLYTNEYNSFAK